MVACDVVYLGALGAEFEDFANHLHVLWREIRFSKLPDIDDVAIEHKNFWLDGFEVITDFLGMAAERSEVEVAEDANLYSSF